MQTEKYYHHNTVNIIKRCYRSYYASITGRKPLHSIFVYVNIMDCVQCFHLAIDEYTAK